MRIGFIAIIVLTSSTLTANAVEATFLGAATYAAPADCAKVAKLAAGAKRTLYSVPETLTATGYRSWEGSCTIEKIAPKVAGKSWIVSLSCSEGAVENEKSTQTWTKAAKGALTVTAQGTTTRLVACAAPKTR